MVTRQRLTRRFNVAVGMGIHRNRMKLGARQRLSTSMAAWRYATSLALQQKSLLLRSRQIFCQSEKHDSSCCFALCAEVRKKLESDRNWSCVMWA